MKIFKNKNKLIKFIKNEKKLGFVPTMGALHTGHVSLIKKSTKENDITLVSIYVNKPQFNKKNDYIKYPRILKKDIILLKKNKVDCVYIPSSKQIYPNGTNKKIKISSFSKKLCGKSRPGHFNAVVDVIDRFIKIINPNKIYMGEKDMQQLKIIEEYVKKNYKKIIITGCRTVREKNGIAFSSRNFLLTTKEKSIASKIYKLLLNKKKKLIKKKISLKEVKKFIINLGANKIDYVEILDINKITTPFNKKIKYRIFISYYLGKIRLIDNI